MSEHAFRNIEELNIESGSPEWLSNGIHIILLKPTEPPPHLSIMVHGSVFSISVSGPRVNWALSELLRTIRTKKIPTLFISLKKPASVLVRERDMKECIHDLTVLHPGVKADEVSCLFPIMEFCKTVYNIDISKVKVIFDLLDQLNEKNVIQRLSQMNMTRWIVDGAFHIERYGEDDVNKMIANLNNSRHATHRKEH